MTSLPGHRRLVLGVAAVALVPAIGGCGGDESPTVQPPSAAPSASPAESTTLISAETVSAQTARCRPPSAEVLAGALTAFDGVVRSTDGDRVTLEVTRWYAGTPTELATVEAPAEDMQALVAAVSFEEEGRYLVAARQDGLLVCGLSAPYTEDLAALYAEAFGG